MNTVISSSQPLVPSGAGTTAGFLKVPVIVPLLRSAPAKNADRSVPSTSRFGNGSSRVNGNPPFELGKKRSSRLGGVGNNTPSLMKPAIENRSLTVTPKVVDLFSSDRIDPLRTWTGVSSKLFSRQLVLSAVPQFPRIRLAGENGWLVTARANEPSGRVTPRSKTKSPDLLGSQSSMTLRAPNPTVTRKSATSGLVPSRTSTKSSLASASVLPLPGSVPAARSSPSARRSKSPSAVSGSLNTSYGGSPTGRTIHRCGSVGGGLPASTPSESLSWSVSASVGSVVITPWSRRTKPRTSSKSRRPSLSVSALRGFVRRSNSSPSERPSPSVSALLASEVT